MIVQLSHDDIRQAIRRWREAHEAIQRQGRYALDAQRLYDGQVELAFERLRDCRTMSDLLTRYYYVDSQWVSEIVHECRTNAEMTVQICDWIQGAAFWVRYQELLSGLDNHNG